MDLFVNNYRLNPNRFYHNQSAVDSTSFVEASEALGIRGRPTDFGSVAYYGHSIGVAWGDLNEDGLFDLVVSNLAHPRFYDFSNKSEILVQTPEGTFDDLQGDFDQPIGGAGLRYQETHSVPVLGDFNLDGHLDLVISAVYEGRPTDFYYGQGDGHFTLDSYHAGIDTENGWGMSAADFDHDGDLDLVTSGGIYRNERSAPDDHHWLKIRVVGDVDSNYAGIGATISVISGDLLIVRSIEGGSAQGNQNSLVAHFGLGTQETIERIEVRYIGGTLVTYDGPFDADQHLKVYESGTVEILP
jgi:hypothetical protein